MKISLIIVLIVSVVPYSIAQKRKRNWDISVSYGFAIPVGGFKKVAPAKDIEAVPYGTSGQVYYNVYGVPKDGNSYATNGQFGSLDVRYHIDQHWLATLAIHQSKNAVNTEAFLNYASKVVVPPITAYSNNDYNVTAWSAGFGYEFNINQFHITLIPVIGQASISSPDYIFEWYTYPFFFDVTELNNSLLLGLHGNINFKFRSRFYASLKADFDSANFDYTVKMHSPGTNFLFLDDRITYRLLKIGLTFGVRF